MKFNTDEIVFETGASSKVFINDTGDLTVGASEGNLGKVFIKQAANTDTEGFALLNSGGGNSFRLFLGDSSGAVAHLGHGGQKQLNVTQAGNVGIGVAGPNRKFQVKSAGTNAVQMSLLDNDSTNEIWRVGQATDGDGYAEVLEDGGTVGCKLDASGNSFTLGNFGVGTASPGVKLHVDSGSSYSVGTFNSSHSNGILINLQRGGTNTGFIGSGKNVADATGGVDDVGIRAQSNLIFTSGGGTERARITSGGRLGVGTTSPDHIFEVESNNSSIAVSRSSANAQLLFKSNSVGQAGQIQVDESSGGGYMDFYTKNTSGTVTKRLSIDTNGQATFTGTNTGNPIGIIIKNTNTANYSHGRLRIESQNGAKYTDIWTDVPNDACRIGYNSSASLMINKGNAFANTSVSTWHNDYRVFQAGQASMSGKNPQDGSPAYFSNNAYYDSTNSRWEFISTDDASQIMMENGSIFFKNGGTGSANGAITWSTNARFTQSGHLRMGAGKGIDFGDATDIASGETVSGSILTDYEEGTWTPTNSTVGLEQSSASLWGFYQKVGNYVTANFGCRVANNGSGHGMYLDGLPFNNVETASGGYRFGGYIFYTTTTNSHNCSVGTNSSRIYIWNNTGTQVAMSHFDNHYIRGVVYLRVA